LLGCGNPALIATPTPNVNNLTSIVLTDAPGGQLIVPTPTFTPSIIDQFSSPADPLSSYQEPYASEIFSNATLCLIEPWTKYPPEFSLLDDDPVTLLGLNAQKDWILIEKAAEVSGESCWVPETALPDLTVDQKAALPFMAGPSSCTLSLLFERARMYTIMDEMNSEGEEPMEPQPLNNYEGCESTRSEIDTHTETHTENETHTH